METLLTLCTLFLAFICYQAYQLTNKKPKDNTEFDMFFPVWNRNEIAKQRAILGEAARRSDAKNEEMMDAIKSETPESASEIGELLEIRVRSSLNAEMLLRQHELKYFGMFEDNIAAWNGGDIATLVDEHEKRWKPISGYNSFLITFDVEEEYEQWKKYYFSRDKDASIKAVKKLLDMTKSRKLYS